MPKRIIVKRSAKSSRKANDVVKRTRSFGPKTSVITATEARKQVRHEGLDPLGRWRFRKESVLLAKRRVPFLITFASPGKIVENLGTLLNLSFHCAFDCEFCYLQTVMPPDHIVYSNVERLEFELATEPLVHAAILSVWSVISFGQKREFVKIPQNFSRVGNYIRERFQTEQVTSDEQAIDLLFRLTRDPKGTLYRKFLSKRERDGHGKPVIKKSHLRVPKTQLADYFMENRKHRPRINTSEYSDFLGVDQIAGNTSLLMECLAKYQDIEFKFRTKSANVDELVKHDGFDRTEVAINFNTELAISRYEHGTASLEERLQAAKKIQNAKRFGLRVVIEPIVMYEGWVEDYRNLVSRITREIDPVRVMNFTFSTARFGAKLQSRIRRNWPGSDLLDQRWGLYKEDGDTKYRYPLGRRVEIYTAMIGEVRRVAPGAVIQLGAETPEAWKALKLDAAAHIGKTVFQYSQQGRSVADHNS